MDDHLKKHLILQFVLPQIIFCIFLVGVYLIHAPNGLLTIFTIGFMLFWILVTIHAIKSVAAYLDELHHNLEKIENGFEVDPEESHLISDHFFTVLQGISTHIKKQEAEIQNEKIRRLRSVIDGQDKERNRLSRELHDSIGQSLIAVKLQLEHAETQQYSQVRAGVDVAKNKIDQTIEEVRRVCNALMPAALNEFGLESALRARCNEMSTFSGFQADFESEGAFERMDNKSKIYLYRIAQEALNNIAKHARATQVAMKLCRDNNIIRLEVTDNGKGFIFDPVCFAQRNGLQNMRERAQLLHGSFEIESSPGSGTKIKVTIPYIIGNGKDKNYTG